MHQTAAPEATTEARIKAAHDAFTTAVESQSGIAEAWVAWKVESEVALTEQDNARRAANQAAQLAHEARMTEWRSISQEIAVLGGGTQFPGRAERVKACLERISAYTGTTATSLTQPPSPGPAPRGGVRGPERAPLSFEADLIAATQALIERHTA